MRVEKVVREYSDMQLKVEEAVMEYGDMLFRVCMVLLCNEQDAQDVVQDTFCS